MAATLEFIHISRWWLRFGRWITLVLALVGFGVVYFWLAQLLITQTNHTDKDILGADQKHNLKLALQTRQDLTLDFTQGVSEPIKNWFPHRTDGVVNPLWPWVAAWLSDADHPLSADGEVSAQDRILFNRGRWFHVGMTLGFLIILGVACARVYSLPAALNVVSLVGLGALLPRAVYFQPEPIYFVFFLLTWVSCIFALKCNTLWAYGAVGVFSGIAYLAKGSIHPLMLAFVGVSTLRWAWGWITSHWPGHSTTLWVRRNHLLGLFVMAMSHLMTAGPRLAYSAEQYGSALHSYPGYWMWFDHYDDCFQWMNDHGTKDKLLALTDADRPSFKNYSSTHSQDQMLDRLVQGTQVKLTEFLWPGKTAESRTQKPWKGLLELRGVYLGFLLVMLVVLSVALLAAVPRAQHSGESLHPETAAIVLFVAGSFVGYALLYGWYTPIGRGDRFMLSLYAPMVLSLVWACEALIKRARRRKAGRWFFASYLTAQWLLLAALVWRVVEIVLFPQFRN